MKDILTIAIPVYERDKFFRTALESAIFQTMQVRIIVVDNASKSFDFQKVIEEYPAASVTYHRNPVNLGYHGNMNQCIKLCPTPYVLILHDDDVLERDFIEKLSHQFDPEVDFYWCKVSIIDEHGGLTRKDAVNYEAFQKIEPWCMHNGSYQGAVMRCARVIELGAFDPRVRIFSDWNLNVKFMLYSRTRFLAFHGMRYRICQYGDSAKLLKDYRYFAYARNQSKRNFHRAGLWQTYQAARFSGEMSVPQLKQVLQFEPQLPPFKLKYFCGLLIRTKATNPRRRIAKLLIKLIGWRGVFLLGRLWRWTGPFK
jgi:glycosyltransferase involved in cell wall biosynthesis